MRVGIYARYSSDRQSDTSLDDQIRLCRARANREEWTVVNVYRDAATSGALRMRRGYQALLADALSGKFDVVLAELLDRLNRDLEEFRAALQAAQVRQCWYRYSIGRAYLRGPRLHHRFDG